MDSNQPFRKAVNAFIPTAAPSGLVIGAALREVDRLSKKWGGLWVGGSIECSEGLLSFRANSLNEAFHKELEPVEIPTNRIQSIRREFGWVTGIVIVNHQDGVFRFRCYAAKRVAAELSTRLGLA